MGKLILKIPLLVAILNFLLYIIMYSYSIMNYGSTKKVFRLIYQIVPMKYLLYSGFISILAIILTVVFLLYKKISVSVFASAIILNVLYFGAYIYWISRQ